MIRKVLIANRGEIALRILRACRELGIQTVAVYSEPDEQSLHVHLADEAICIGPGPSAESYLRTDRIISAAEIANVDAIHPGYGFLSENADFAEQCETCNIHFIGPKAATIRQMGDKALARETVSKANVPIIPGSDGPIENESEAMKTAKKIGFPVIIKAVAGGGGRGMRIAHNAMAFAKEYETASMEAEKAFGNGSMYIEKYLENPRHIEFQILADNYGKIIHLGERDCSVQRRHQKVIEEAPSPYLDAKLRKRMGDVAIKAAVAANYVNAGTIEFLLDQNDDFYFIEMNTRIQVEHGVTEEATGIDLIKEQIEIANGKRLLYDQKKIVLERHAVECRICAEDPANDFAPSPGKIGLYYPPGGHGVRVDSHVYGGYVISPYYDSMISKVIAHGRTRKIALDRMYRALSEYLIRGVKTNVGFAKAIVVDPAFRQGEASTGYIEEFLKRTPKNLFSKDKHLIK
ncbi:MAG: acetyl-CoA carboxylase biotin carboxylase subunit [Opitutae bacterium]|nr:acetyl-CoA carboxylase biotin carboxylase subunit [Opitutae bacterium]|tara:strand:- start:7756 stop:9141 length:1386 start_codon:yes stop_codon:yes gene_type:complete